jgi:hypothetical protein
MNISDFNTNFTVTIKQFDDTTSNVAVNYQVVCLPNSRKSLHTAVVDTTLLSEGYTDNDVVLAGWNSIKSTVNTWALYNITEVPLTTLAITSTSNVISLSAFNTNFTVNVVHFNLIPAINPTHWVIQLSVLRNGTSIGNVFEGYVPLTESYCNNTLCSDIAQAAWELVKNPACDWALANMPTDSVVDTVYTPASI